MRRGTPIHLAARLQDADYRIVAQDQAEDRGFVQYSLMAYNVHRLWRVHRVMHQSLVKTLAEKQRTSVKKVYRKYRTTVSTPHGTLRVLAVRHERGKEQAPLVARFGGIALRWQRSPRLNDQPKAVCGKRSEVVPRLLAQVCEVCGARETCAVHPMRKLADLHRPGQREKPPWVQRLAARRRKTLVVCRQCHEDMHRERPARRRVAA